MISLSPSRFFFLWIVTGQLVLSPGCFSWTCPKPLSVSRKSCFQRQQPKQSTRLHNSSLSPSESSSSHRRTLLSTIPSVLITGAAVVTGGVPFPAHAASLLTTINLDKLTTVVLDSPENKIGVQLVDSAIGADTYVTVKSLNPNGQAAASGVQEGMVLVTKSKNAAEVVAKIQQGPYPMAFQFYSLVGGNDDPASTTPLAALERAQSDAATKPKNSEPQGPPVSSRGAGLGVKTITKPQSKCAGAKRGDKVTIRFEARVASPGGPLYDSTELRDNQVTTFVMGDGQAINGVDIGMGGMCPGEVRELDIPAGLGYGRYGSEVFDIPGDVRLWWRLELLELEEKEQRKKSFSR